MSTNNNGEDKNKEKVEQGEEKQGEEKMKNPRKKQSIIIAVAAVLLVGFVVGSVFGGAFVMGDWFGNGENGFEEARPQLEQQLKEAKEHELIMQHLENLREASIIETNLDVIGEGDKDAAVATINGEKIIKEELLELEEQEKQQLVMMGMDPESEEAAQMIEQQRPQLLENLIMNAILLQKVEDEGITVSEEEVEEEYRYYAEQFGGEEMLEQQLQQAGLTADDLKQEIARQLPIIAYVDNYIKENLDEDELDFSEEELRELYEQQQMELEMQQQMEQQMELDMEQQD